MYLKQIYKHHKIIIDSLLFLALIIVILTVLLYYADRYYNYFDFTDHGKISSHNGIAAIDAFHAIVIATLTASLVYAAWFQLASLKSTAKADFLMRLDDRYGSEPILKARQIIQRLYRESKTMNPTASETIHRYNIAIKINEISEDINLSEDYIYLLNLLDFLETVSYFANRNDITHEDIRDLMGLSLEFFYTIFKPRIDARRSKYTDKSIYTEFENLVMSLKKDSNSEMPS